MGVTCGTLLRNVKMAVNIKDLYVHRHGNPGYRFTNYKFFFTNFKNRSVAVHTSSLKLLVLYFFVYLFFYFYFFHGFPLRLHKLSQNL